MYLDVRPEIRAGQEEENRLQVVVDVTSPRAKKKVSVQAVLFGEHPSEVLEICPHKKLVGLLIQGLNIILIALLVVQMSFLTAK